MADREIRVWLAQCLCPQRHCILAAIHEADGEAEARAVILSPLREQIEGMLKIKALNPWCGICRSPIERWSYEVGRTHWTTMAEAEPHVRQLEAEQIATGLMFGELSSSGKAGHG